MLAPPALVVVAVGAACTARPNPAKENGLDSRALSSTGSNRSVDGAGPITAEPETAPAALAAAEKAAFDVARPVFEEHCFRCHTRAGRKAKAKALRHIDMGHYPFGGHHASDAGSVIRTSVVGNPARGKKPTMPSDDPGTVVGDELQKILTWAEAFDRSHAPAASPGHSPERHKHR